ncbi:MAG: MBL fold metallo-hydrolase [Desulfobacteraceae bacterium]
MTHPEKEDPEYGVRILGSGTCVPSIERSSCAALVTAGNENLLIDIGSGTIRRLIEAGHRITDIDAVLLTHFHADHSSDLPAFLFALKYPEMNITGKKLHLIGGTGINRFYNDLDRAFENHLDPGSVLEITELDEVGKTPLSFRNVSVSWIKTVHKDESRAYRFTFPNGFTVVYSGDTDYSENLVRLCRDADVLVAESAMPDEKKVPGHLTPSLAGKIAQRANVGKLVLTHFYPECNNVDIESQCRKTFSGSVCPGRDLMWIPAFK